MNYPAEDPTADLQTCKSPGPTPGRWVWVVLTVAACAIATGFLDVAGARSTATTRRDAALERAEPLELRPSACDPGDA